MTIDGDFAQIKDAEIRTTIVGHTQEAPVKIVALARKLGLKVKSVANWPEGISGAIEADETSSGGYTIFFNEAHSRVRNRFTVAHEIAHFLLHKEKIGDGITDDRLYRSGQSSQVEREANQLAADILMPTPLVMARWQDPSTTVESLAQEFEVSSAAMSIKLSVPY